MKIVIITQARMTSTRLPGKVLKPVLGKPLLGYHIERLLRSKCASQVVVATTTNQTDEPIIAFCKDLKVHFYRGSEDDVLSRYYGAALEYNADVIVRVTSDCPLIDPKIIDEIVDYFLNHPDLDYVSNTLTRTFPRGMDVEVFSFRALEQAYTKAVLPAEREHVTPYINNGSGNFNVAGVVYHSDESQYRLTVDTAEDFCLITKILEGIYCSNPEFSLEDILRYLWTFPDLPLINAHIEQKKL